MAEFKSSAIDGGAVDVHSLFREDFSHPVDGMSGSVKGAAQNFLGQPQLPDELPHALGVHDHGGVAMSLVQREFIHHQAMNVVGHELAVQSLQAAMVDVLDGVPVQPG